MSHQDVQKVAEEFEAQGLPFLRACEEVVRLRERLAKRDLMAEAAIGLEAKLGRTEAKLLRLKNAASDFNFTVSDEDKRYGGISPWVDVSDLLELKEALAEADV